MIWQKTSHGPDLWGAWVSDLATGGDLVVVQRGPQEFGAAVRDRGGKALRAQEGFARLEEAQTWAEKVVFESEGDG